MGVIQRQGIKESIVTYVGVIIGFASTIWIYPLEKELYGLAQFLISVAILLVPFLSLGIGSVILKFFPEFEDPKTGHHGFLGMLLSVGTVVFLIIGTVLIVVRKGLYRSIEWMGLDSLVFAENFLEIGVLCFLLLLISIFTLYVSCFQRIVVSNLLFSFSVKLVLPVLVLMYFWEWIGTGTFKWSLVGLHFFVVAALVIYTASLGQLHLRPDWKHLTGGLLVKMGRFSIYGILGTIGALLALRIDTIMVASIAGYGSTGIYGIANNIANVVGIPFTSFSRIAAPILSRASYQGRMDEVRSIYRRSSLVMLCVGLFFFLGIWISIDDLFRLTSDYEGLIVGKYVVLFLGLAKLVDMVSGVNGEIIGFSPYYRFNVLAVVILAVLNIVTNYLLIPRYGITGASLATLTSVLVYNSAKLIFVWSKFGMQPFSLTSLKVLAIAGLIYLGATLLPDTGYVLTNIALRSGSTVLVFGGAILYFNLVPDITDLARQGLAKARALLGK